MRDQVSRTPTLWTLPIREEDRFETAEDETHSWTCCSSSHFPQEMSSINDLCMRMQCRLHAECTGNDSALEHAHVHDVSQQNLQQQKSAESPLQRAHSYECTLAKLCTSTDGHMIGSVCTYLQLFCTILYELQNMERVARTLTASSVTVVTRRVCKLQASQFCACVFIRRINIPQTFFRSTQTCCPSLELQPAHTKPWNS